MVGGGWGGGGGVDWTGAPARRSFLQAAQTSTNRRTTQPATVYDTAHAFYFCSRVQWIPGKTDPLKERCTRITNGEVKFCVALQKSSNKTKENQVMTRAMTEACTRQRERG